MFVAIVGNRVYVSLSRRNLRQLDAMLDTNGGCIKCLTRKDESGVSLIVHVEEDGDHYGGRGNRSRVPCRTGGQPPARSIIKERLS
jgi:hypothetical protein